MMIYPDFNRLHEEFTSQAREEPGHMLNCSITRAKALLDSAWLNVTEAKVRHTIPNGKFSDAECALWELFCEAIRAGKEL